MLQLLCPELLLYGARSNAAVPGQFELPGGSTIIKIRVGVGTCIAQTKGRCRAGEDMATIAFRHDVYARASAALHGAAAEQGLRVQQVDGEWEAHEVAAKIRALTDEIVLPALAGQFGS